MGAPPTGALAAWPRSGRDEPGLEPAICCLEGGEGTVWPGLTSAVLAGQVRSRVWPVTNVRSGYGRWNDDGNDQPAHDATAAPPGAEIAAAPLLRGVTRQGG